MSLEGYCSPSCPAAKEIASFSSAGRDAIFNYRSLGVFSYGRSYSLSANVRIKLYRHHSSQPQLLLPVQVATGQNWKGANSLACNRLNLHVGQAFS